MTLLPNFIGDLAIIMISAGISTIIFKWLKQPVVLGYIVAGYFAAPHITWLPTVSDMSNVETWAQIGIIFLLFALGLDFSFKKLVEIGGTASVATLVNLCSMVITGYTLGQLLGWDTMNSIFLGGMLSMSSTIIIIKAFSDMGLQKQKFAGIVFGMLIVEDLAAILMMVILSTFAVSRQFEGAELVNSVLKLMFFMLIWFVVGIYLIPTILKRVKKHLNDETLLIVAVGMCLGMVLFASEVGFSAALGAFIMGSILAETIEAKHIEHLIQPLKNLFGAVFFVSVGMILDPNVLTEYTGVILLITAATVCGRMFFATMGVLASGEGLKVAMQSGFSLGQIGEFSFIIATLGTSLGVISHTLYPIIIAVSVLSTFTTPYCIRMAVPAYNFLEKRIPSRFQKIIKGYGATGYKRVSKENDWKKLLISILKIIVIYSALSVAILILFQRFISVLILALLPNTWGSILIAIVALLIMAPFLRAIMMRKNKSPEFIKLWRYNPFNRSALIILVILRIALCAGISSALLIPLFPNHKFMMVVISFLIMIVIIFFKGFKQQSKRIEARFLENFHRKQFLADKELTILPGVANDLLSKNIHVKEVIIPQNSPCIGYTLKELNFRQHTGVNIVSIIRGHIKMNIPSGREKLYPFDKIVVVGSDDELETLIDSLACKEVNVDSENDHTQFHISLSQHIIESGSPIAGKSIAEAAIRENTECMVIGIDRAGQSIIHFSPEFRFKHGDVLWLAGEKDRLASFEENIYTDPLFFSNM